MARFIRQGDHALEGHALQLAIQVAERSGQSLADLLANHEGTAALLSQFPDTANPIRLHGSRVEEMFGHVVAALGQAKAIKREDAGSVTVADEVLVSIPDYRLMLKDGREIFVEVKNFRDKNLFTSIRFKLHYLQRLAAYSTLFKRPAYISIFWSTARIWTMHPVPELIKAVTGKFLYLEFPQAIASSHMRIIGDALIGTIYPLTFRLHVDSELLSRSEEEARYQMTIRDVKMFAGGKELIEKRDKDIAWLLMQNNRWEEKVTNTMEENSIISVDFSFTPIDAEDLDQQGFGIVTSLSTLASSQFNSLTLDDGKTTRIRVPFVDEIPYFGDVKRSSETSLPIWKFIQKPQRLANVL